MDETTKKISALLHEAGETHHVVYRITDGEDDDWASFYGDWLVRLSELPELLGSTPVKSHLVASSSRSRARSERRAAGRTSTRSA